MINFKYNLNNFPCAARLINTSRSFDTLSAPIQKNTMKKIILALCLMTLAMGVNALTLEECVLRGNSPKGIGAMQPSKSDGRYFYRLSDDGNAINRISYAKGDESVLVDTRDQNVSGWDDFEVTADGAYVLLWNNSQEIYRYSFSADYYVYDLKNKTMKALSDGGGEEIATLSPDGKRVVYLCFHKGDLAPNQHLANKHVLLRMIPAEGGTPRTLLELFGGQGTINVNSWAPDSRRFAFVSYRVKE